MGVEISNYLKENVAISLGICTVIFIVITGVDVSTFNLNDYMPTIILLILNLLIYHFLEDNWETIFERTYVEDIKKASIAQKTHAISKIGSEGNSKINYSEKVITAFQKEDIDKIDNYIYETVLKLIDIVLAVFNPLIFLFFYADNDYSFLFVVISLFYIYRAYKCNKTIKKHILNYIEIHGVD